MGFHLKQVYLCQELEVTLQLVLCDSLELYLATQEPISRLESALADGPKPVFSSFIVLVPGLNEIRCY